MILKLRLRFIVTTMVSLMLVLTVIMGLILTFNYRGVIAEADRTLSILSANNGTFPKKETGTQGRAQTGEPPEPMAPDMKQMSPELPYESRYFSVLLSGEGEVISADTGKIAAIDTETAIRLARNVYSASTVSGFTGNYRYSKNTTDKGEERIIFLDCTKSLSTFRTFLMTSVAISIFGLLAVFVLIFFLSKRMIRPFLESYEKQKQFITDAGHELKTPLTIINADVEVLEMEQPDNEWTEDIRLQTRRLVSLTNDLILLSKMEEANPPVTMVELPFSDLASETAQSFQALAKSRQKTLDIQIEPMLTLRGDEKALRQLITILLDNALKYSDPHGEITFSLARQKKMICLTIANTTDAPLPKQLDMLFDRFYRADASRSHSTRGFGLGLSIARRIVEVHKGKILASQDNGHRLKIQILLPRA